MSTQLSPLNDLLMVYDYSAGEYGAASIFNLMKSAITGGGSALSITPNASTGKLDFSINLGGYVQADRKVSAGYGLSGGGDLSADVALSFDLGDLTVAGAVDQASDLLAYYSVGGGVTRSATISDITKGLTDAKPLGSIV